VRSGPQGRNTKEARGIEEKEARACSSVADEEKGRKEEGKRKTHSGHIHNSPFGARKTKP